MTENEITLVADHLQGELQETHISWVILTKDFAYKIKKPLKFSFLDFSSLDKRIHFCKEEYRLNSRLTTIYQGIVYLELGLNNTKFHNELNEQVSEVAVKMQRLKDEDRMDRRLAQNSVTESDILGLAYKIGDFHHKAKKISAYDELPFVEKRFKDVLQVGNWIKYYMGTPSLKVLERSVAFHNSFLRSNESLFNQRVERNFKKDVHGDLHTQNIFLSHEPVIFDCIEFNPLYREIDALNEVAFLCMDLEVKGRNDLSNLFLRNYLEQFNCIENDRDKRLFEYYKCYRANVKIKVIGLRAIQDKSTEKRSYKRLIEKYISLLDHYMRGH